MKKQTILSLLFIALISNAIGEQDSFITVSPNGAGLCWAVDSKDNSVCENQTLQIEGTADHSLYILPETVLKPNSTVKEHLDYGISIPIGVLTVFLFFGIIFALVILAVVFLGNLMGMWKNGNKIA